MQTGEWREKGLQTTLENGVTLWTKPQFILGVDPNKLKAGDIIALHKSSRHSEHFRVLIVENECEHGICADAGIARFRTVILFTARSDYFPGQNYVFWTDNMMRENWRIV